MQLSELTQAIIFLIPGFLATEFKNFLSPTLRRSDFERLVESVVLSLGSYGVTYLLFSFLFGVVKNHGAIPRGPVFIVPDYIVALLLGYAWARILGSERFYMLAERIFGTQYVSEPSFWAEILRFPKRGKFRGGWVRVYLDDGSKYIGAVTRYTTDPNRPDKELVLEKIYSVDENDLPIGDPLPIKVYIPGSRVVAIHVLPHPAQGSSSVT